MSVHSSRKIEFGDFQTPSGLCVSVCDLLSSLDVSPTSIIEPTCGRGSFLRASIEAFPDATECLGFEINSDYAKAAANIVRATVRCENFFEKDWEQTLGRLPEPILVIGNPPWVTNSTVGALGGKNLPAKSNFQHLTGLDAITGKSNFDISESMLVNLIEHLSGRSAVLAMLCKTTVARKVMQDSWLKRRYLKRSAIYLIDAMQHFGAAVDACLLVCMLEPGTVSQRCMVYRSLDALTHESAFGLHNGHLLADLEGIQVHNQLHGRSPLKWRSGIKHDCSSVMELWPTKEGVFKNGLGEVEHLEFTYLYPMLKSSELVKASPTPSRFMLVPQRSIGGDTSRIEEEAPLTWNYLVSHEHRFISRSSSIYQNRPRFSIFGVGSYSFSPWKVAISGFYKGLEFRCIGPINGKPIVLDDTSYFLPCETKEDAIILLNILDSKLVRDYFRTLVFWDQKRPITAKLLDSLDLGSLATELGVSLPVYDDPQGTLPLFR